MKCSRCSHDNSSGKYCVQCGAPLGSIPPRDSYGYSVQRPGSSKPSKLSTKNLLIILAAIVIALVVSLIPVIAVVGRRPKTTTSNTGSSYGEVTSPETPNYSNEDNQSNQVARVSTDYIGEPVSIGGVVVTVTSVSTRQPVGTFEEAWYGENTIYIVSVLFKNGNTASQVYGSDYKYRDSSGQIQTFLGLGIKPAPNGLIPASAASNVPENMALSAGQRREEQYEFGDRPGATGLELVYAPFDKPNTRIAWKLESRSQSESNND